jgi:hypothetical protein
MSEEGNMPTFQFKKLLNDEQELYKWLVTMITQTGIARVENAPKEKGQLQILGERVGYLMETTYGLVSMLMLPMLSFLQISLMCSLFHNLPILFSSQGAFRPLPAGKILRLLWKNSDQYKHVCVCIIFSFLVMEILHLSIF